MTRLRTNATDHACLGDGPKLMQSLALASHFMKLSAANEECKAKTCQSNVCMCV